MRFVGVQCKACVRDPLLYDRKGVSGFFCCAAEYDESSSPGESHPQALTEPDVNLSAHPALIVQSQVEFQFAKARTSWVLGGQHGPTSERLVEHGERNV